MPFIVHHGCQCFVDKLKDNQVYGASQQNPLPIPPLEEWNIRPRAQLFGPRGKKLGITRDGGRQLTTGHRSSLETFGSWFATSAHHNCPQSTIVTGLAGFPLEVPQASIWDKSELAHRSNIAWHSAYRSYNIHALSDVAKDNVLVVEPRSLSSADEELAAIGAGAGVRHRQDA